MLEKVHFFVAHFLLLIHTDSFFSAVFRLFGFKVGNILFKPVLKIYNPLYAKTKNPWLTQTSFHPTLLTSSRSHSTNSATLFNSSKMKRYSFWHDAKLRRNCDELRRNCDESHYYGFLNQERPITWMIMGLLVDSADFNRQEIQPTLPASGWPGNPWSFLRQSFLLPLE